MRRADPDASLRLRVPLALDLRLTLSPLRHGPRDPTIRLAAVEAWRATRTADGPATLRIVREDHAVVAAAWGPGAAAALGGVARSIGLDDDPSALRLPTGPLRDLARRFAGLRFGRTDAVMESLVPAIVEQKVVGQEAQRSYRALVLRYGEPAPGPAGLWLAPSPAVLAALPYHALHPLGIEQRRAATLARAAGHASWLEGASRLGGEEGRRRLQGVVGVGPWTAAETARAAWGDPDAVSVGDYHTPSLVAWHLAGEARADDARMLELLEPFRGQRARLVRLLELSGRFPPRRGSRLPLRSIARV